LERNVKKLIALTLLALAVVAGATAVVTVHPQIVFADPDGGGGNGK
jgi:hypothetical protein